MSYPDIEAALMDYLDDLGYTVTATPLDLQTVLLTEPVIRIQRVGGDDDARDNQDYPNVVIQCYVLKDSTASRAGHDLAETVRERMTAIENDGGVYIAAWNALICDCQTVVGPVELTYLDSTVAVFQCSYRLTTKGR